jgi:flagellar hook-associated protein 3 FlgL
MSTTSIGGNTALIIQSLVDMRARFNDLQRQLATGQKSDTYAGLGLNRGVTVMHSFPRSAVITTPLPT